MGRGWPLRTSPDMGYHTESDSCWSNDTSVYVWRPDGESGPLLLLRLPRSLKVIGSDTDRSTIPMTSYQWSIVTMGLFCTVFKIQRDIGRILRIFPPTHLYFSPPFTVLPLEFCNGACLGSKSRMMELPGREWSLMISLAVSI